MSSLLIVCIYVPWVDLFQCNVLFRAAAEARSWMPERHLGPFLKYQSRNSCPDLGLLEQWLIFNYLLLNDTQCHWMFFFIYL